MQGNIFLPKSGDREFRLYKIDAPHAYQQSVLAH